MPSRMSNPLVYVQPPFQDLETQDYACVTESLITDPTVTNPLLEGEWVDLVASGGQLKFQRAVATSSQPQLYAGQRGRTDIQVTKKAPLILGYPNRIKTKLVSGASSLVVGDPVMVGAVVVDGQNKIGLIKATGSGNYVLGVVEVAGTNTGAPDGSYWTIHLYRNPRLIP